MENYIIYALAFIPSIIITCVCYYSLITIKNHDTLVLSQTVESDILNKKEEIDAEKKYINGDELYEKFNKVQTILLARVILITDKFWTNKIHLDPTLEHFVIETNDHKNEFVYIITQIDEPLHIILHTDGGDIDTNDKMVKSLMQFSKHHPIITYIPYSTYSAGMMLALTGQTINIGPYVVIGGMDPQIVAETPNIDVASIYQADIIIKAFDKIKTPTLLEGIVYEQAKKYYDESISTTKDLLNYMKYNEETINNVIKELCVGKYTHCKPYGYQELKNIGLNVEINIPKCITELMKEFFIYKAEF